MPSQSNINFINYQLSRDVTVNQNQSTISREDVHVCSHSNPIEKYVFVIKEHGVSEFPSLYHKEDKISVLYDVFCYSRFED